MLSSSTGTNSSKKYTIFMLFSVGLSICGMDIQMRCGHLVVVVAVYTEYMYIYQLNICEAVNKGTLHL